MATSVARIGQGTSLAFSSFSAEINSIDGPSGEADSIDVTHLLTPGAYRQFIQGLLNAGEVSMDINFHPSIYTPLELGVDTLVITFPDGSTFSCEAFCTKFGLTIPVDNKMNAATTFKFSGQPTFVLAP